MLYVRSFVFKQLWRGISCILILDRSIKHKNLSPGDSPPSLPPLTRTIRLTMASTYVRMVVLIFTIVGLLILWIAELHMYVRM